MGDSGSEWNLIYQRRAPGGPFGVFSPQGAVRNTGLVFIKYPPHRKGPFCPYVTRCFKGNLNSLGAVTCL